MANRRVDPRRISRHLSYRVEEAADALGVHKNTLRQWIKQGLPLADAERPILVWGGALRDFLDTRKAKHKAPLKPGQFYCLKCRTPTRPDLDMADYIPRDSDRGHLAGFCPGCSRMIYRAVSRAKLAIVGAGLDLSIQPWSETPKRDENTPPQS